MQEIILKRAKQEPNKKLEELFLCCLKKLISSNNRDEPAVITTLSTLPGMAELESKQAYIDPISLYKAINSFKEIIGIRLKTELHELLKTCKRNWDKQWPSGQGERSLTLLAWSWLAAGGDLEIRNEALQATQGDSMTLAKAGLISLLPIDCKERELALGIFFERWKELPIVLDSWFNFMVGRKVEEY